MGVNLNPLRWISSCGYIEAAKEDWDRLLAEPEKRPPRRLMSQKEFNRLKEQRPT
ncbi:MAG TPA: hypothetical protein VHD32_14775 [Candidatus Didemnitutus sp.]|nr:hypothetical protein [Candidatus Didemnitutus sp.]